MIFALATDERTLLVFPTGDAAIAYCEGIDVETGGWLFWDERGAALDAEFVSPNHQGTFFVGSGAYRLVPAADRPPLQAALSGIVGIEAYAGFETLADVQSHLARATPLPRRDA